MPTITEGIFEDGVLKLADARGLEEQRRYRVIVEEIAAPAAPHDPALAAELARRTTALPGGRRGINVIGLFERGKSDLSFEEIEAALDISRKAQEEEFGELFKPE